MVRCFFLLIHFLVVEEYELPRILSHILTANYTITKSLSSLFSPTLIIVSLMFCVRLLSQLMIMLSNHHVTNHLTCRKKLHFDLKNMKMQYQRYRKIPFCFQSYIDIWEIILYLQANLYGVKTKNINSFIFISTIIK